MRIAIGADHGGFGLKKELLKYLEGKGHDIRDFGAKTAGSCDYPPIGYEAALAVAAKRCDRGILICKSGLGMCMVSNKVPGIRAALLRDEAAARSSREHNDANIAVFSGSSTAPKKAMRLLDIWLSAKFSGGRHQRRVDQINAIEKRIAEGLRDRKER